MLGPLIGRRNDALIKGGGSCLQVLHVCELCDRAAMASDNLHYTNLGFDVPLSCPAMDPDAEAEGVAVSSLRCPSSAVEVEERVRCANCSNHRRCSAVKGAFSRSASKARGDWDMFCQ